MSLTFWRFWGPVMLYMALIFSASAAPRPDPLASTPDIFLHGGAYFVMAVLAVRALSKGLRHRAAPRHLWGGVAIAIVYGASDELHQSFVPGRVAATDDLAFDALGALLAAGSLTLFWNVTGTES